MSRFGKELRERLERKGWEIPVFAEVIGVSRQAVYNWIAGRSIPHFRNMEKIEKAGIMDREEAFRLIFGQK